MQKCHLAENNKAGLDKDLLRSILLIIWRRTLSQTSPSFENTMGNFSFSHSVFYPFIELSPILIKFEIVVCKPFQFGRVYNSSFGKGITRFKKNILFGSVAVDSFPGVPLYQNSAQNTFQASGCFLIFSSSKL